MAEARNRAPPLCVPSTEGLGQPVEPHDGSRTSDCNWPSQPSTRKPLVRAQRKALIAVGQARFGACLTDGCELLTEEACMRGPWFFPGFAFNDDAAMERPQG